MDLKEIENKINKRKAEMIKESTSLGDPVNLPVSSDSMLHGLVQSLQTGTASEAVNKIKAVDQLAEQKSTGGGSAGIVSNAGMSEALMAHVGGVNANTPSTPQPTPQPVVMGDERDKLFEHNLAGGQQSLSNALNNYGQPQTQPPQPMPPQPQFVQQPVTAQNPAMINEQVNAGINKFINENMGVIIQETMKSVMVEMYAVDKVKTAMLENKDLIKKIVRETLIELSNSKKKSSK